MIHKINSEIINCYVGHPEDGEYVPDYLRSTIERNHDSKGLVYSTFQSYNDKGDLDDQYYIRRRQERDVFIYETFKSDEQIVEYAKVNLNGDIIETKTRSGQLFLYEYDEHGQVVTERCIGQEGNEQSKDTFIYDEQGNLTKSIHINIEPAAVRYFYSKDVSGDVVRVGNNNINLYRDSNVYYKGTSNLYENKDEREEGQPTTNLRFFDREGHQLCCIHWGSDETIVTRHMTYSRYDRRGNWVVRITPKWLQDQCLIEVREIEYADEAFDDIF